jgi:hypothetical protein
MTSWTFMAALHSAERISMATLPASHSFHPTRRERSFRGALGSGHFTYLQQQSWRHSKAGELDTDIDDA